MASFYIQTDKDFYFAGDTVNGQVFVNVMAMIVGAQGLSLKFSGYECVKWVQTQELHRPSPPHHQPGQPPPPPPYDPIAAIPPHLLVMSDNMNISDCESQGNTEYDHRPQYIRTSQNRYFKMKYFETRNMFTKQKMMIFNCSGFPPGQFSFPFSFKTFEGWPASFNYHTSQKKGIIIYHMTAAIEPLGPQFQLQGGRQIILRQTRMVQTQNRESNADIKSCCCLAKGRTMSRMSFEKDGYTPGQSVQMIIQIDNSNCEVNVTNINISVNRSVTLRSQGNATSDFASLFTKSINGVQAGQSMIGTSSIRQQFQMPMNPQMKPTCSGKLLSAQYTLAIKLNHDIVCQCCSETVGSSIPIIIFPVVPVYAMPQIFQHDWTPKMMPQTVLILPNNFNNFNLNAMQPQVMPPLPPPNMNMNQGMNNNNMNQGMNNNNMNQGMNNNNMNQGMNNNMNQGMNNNNMNQGMNNNNMNQGIGMNSNNMNQGMGMNSNNMNQGMGMNSNNMNQGMGMNKNMGMQNNQVNYNDVHVNVGDSAFQMGNNFDIQMNARKY